MSDVVEPLVSQLRELIKVSSTLFPFPRLSLNLFPSHGFRPLNINSKTTL